MRHTSPVALPSPLVGSVREGPGVRAVFRRHLAPGTLMPRACKKTVLAR